MELAPGTVLLDKYRIDELIGTGGMGNVVRASHLYLHQAVAIKILLPEMASSDSTKQRFLREAQATVKLRSEHSARVIDVGTTPEGAPFMVMEFLDGNDLNQILRHHGPQLPGIVVDLMLQGCEGIAEAHSLGIVHRDIKPSNFFITQRPDGSMLLKILDFGISKTPVGYDELTGTQTVIGTPSYMAPEQMKSGRAADPRSDIWSIGVVMYQLITGRLPFSGESYAELVLKVGLEPPAPILVPLPTGLAEVILRCLEKDPVARYQSVGELARTLAPYATDPHSAAQSASRTMRTLQQRGLQIGVGAPLGAGLATPIPISPAQLTPRSWPGSQGSLAQGAGQVTMRSRPNRGFLIAGITSLCLVAGVGGYAVSQMSKTDGGRHVQAPPPRSDVQPAAPASTIDTPAGKPATPAPTIVEPAANAAVRPDEVKPAVPTPAAGKPDEHSPAVAKPVEPTPVEPKPAVARPDEHKPTTTRPDEPKPTTARPDEHKPTTARPDEHKPAATRPAAGKPDEHKPTAAKPDERKPASKPAPKPKDPNDLFERRD